MDPFYNPQQQQYPQHGPGQQHFPNNNASHNYFMQHQPQFLHQNANLLPGGGGSNNADQQRLQDGQQQQQTSSFSDGNFQSNQAPYRSLYQPPQAGTTNQDNQHVQGLLVPKVEVEEQPSSPPPPPPHNYGTPPSGIGDRAAASSSGVGGELLRPSASSKENNDSYQCSICYESFPTAKTYKGHMANHKIPMTTYSNETNASSPADVHLLREHILAHVRDHQQFQQLTGAGSGVAVVGAGDSNLIEKCQYCYKLFADRIQLQIHLKEHNALKEYKCLNCNKMYASLNYLKLHYKMHADLKPYKCQYCDKRFTFSSNLYVHHRIHTGHKPYRCEKCSKCFSQINSLKQHHRIHRDQQGPPAVGGPSPPLSTAGPSVGVGGGVPAILNPSGLLGGVGAGASGPALLASSLLPPMIPSMPPQQQLQQLHNNHHHQQQQLHPHPQHPVPQSSSSHHNQKSKAPKDEFLEGTGELSNTSHTEDKVLNMSNRPPNPGELSIQDVIIQQLQQRLVSQP